MVEYFFRKYSGKVSKEVIGVALRKLTEINELIPYNFDFDELMNTYINIEVLKIESQLERIEVDNKINTLIKSQHSLINKSIIAKRESGELMECLSKLTNNQLLELNSLADISSEYRDISERKYWKDKEDRRNKKGVKTITIGGSDYNLNQTL